MKWTFVIHAFIYIYIYILFIYLYIYVYIYFEYDVDDNHSWTSIFFSKKHVLSLLLLGFQAPFVFDSLCGYVSLLRFVVLLCFVHFSFRFLLFFYSYVSFGSLFWYFGINIIINQYFIWKNCIMLIPLSIKVYFYLCHLKMLCCFDLLVVHGLAYLLHISE